MVLDEVWRGLDGVEPLSGPHGGPLRRTVKLILDPLVIRPVQHPACAGPVLSADGAVLLAVRIHAASDVLRATAAWFTLLKQVRRGLRITEGNPQDLYFQRCYELATVRGAPDPERDRRAAEDALLDIHEYTAGRTTQALKQHLSEPGRAAELAGLLEIAWRRRPQVGADGYRPPAFAALLEACAAARLGSDTGDGPDGDRTLTQLIAAHAGTHFGIGLWHSDFAPAAHELGLTAHPAPRRPDVGASASTADMGIAFDRTIYERVFTVLQASSERAGLPLIPELVTTEIARSCAPWALLDESLRVAATAGVLLALGLAPIGVRRESVARHRTVADDSPNSLGAQDGPLAEDSRRSGLLSAVPSSTRDRTGTAASSRPGLQALHPAPHETGWGTGETAAHRIVNSRWQREAYVLQARRLAVDATALPRAESHPGDPLAAIAAELRTPWRPYLRRLWVRLHGRDVREATVHDPDELWDLLDGVARSVILDHRMRVKRALSVHAPIPDQESRAS